MNVGLLTALTDPRLLAPDFAWSERQRELIAAVEANQVVVAAVGRQSGKSDIACRVALHNALLRGDLDAVMRRRKRRTILVVAQNLKMSQVMLDHARDVLEGSPLLSGCVRRGTSEELELRSLAGAKVTLRVVAASGASARGFTASCVLLDEYGHHLEDAESSRRTAGEIWRAVVPATATFGDEARVVVLSTPFGDGNEFAKLFRRAESGELAGAVAIHGSTREFRPDMPDGLLELERERSPLDFEQEYMAEFLSPGDAYLDLSDVEIADDGPLAPAEVRGNQLMAPVVAGLDPSFASDPFGVVILCRDPTNRRRLVVARAAAIGGRGREFEATMSEVVGLLKSYGVSRVVSDQFSSAAVVDRLRRAGLATTVHNVSAPSKTAAYAEVRTRLLCGTLELYAREPGGPELIAEFRRLRTRYSVGSASVYSPRVAGSHGDLASALSLAVYDQRHAAPAHRWLVDIDPDVARAVRPITADLSTRDT